MHSCNGRRDNAARKGKVIHIIQRNRGANAPKLNLKNEYSSQMLAKQRYAACKSRILPVFRSPQLSIVNCQLPHPSASAPESVPSSHSSSFSSHEKENGRHSENNSQFSDEFDELWQLYPKERRQGRSKALSAYINPRRCLNRLTSRPSCYIM